MSSHSPMGSAEQASAAGVAVRDSPGRGVGLYATRAFPEAGCEILIEKPLLLTTRNEISKHKDQNLFRAKVWATYLAFVKAPKEVQDAFLELHSPTDGSESTSVREGLVAGGMAVLSLGKALHSLPVGLRSLFQLNLSRVWVCSSVVPRCCPLAETTRYLEDAMG